MRIKRHIIKNLRNTYFQLKGAGLFVFVPIIIMYVFVPLTNYMCWQFYKDTDLLYLSVLRELQFCFPISSVWNTFFLLEHYVEESGHDLLYIGKRNKFGGLLLVYVIFMIIMVPLFVVYTRIFPDLWWLYLKLGIVSMFFLSMIYLAAFVSGKIVLSVISALSYTIYVIAEISVGMMDISYYAVQVSHGWNLLHEMQGMIIVTILLLAAGCFFNHIFPERS